MKQKLTTLWALFLTFFKIGAFTFGGGYAMISLIQKETVETRGWVTDDDILDIIAIAESTPGPIAINSSTFVGYKVQGVLGAVCATLGMVLPSFVIISVLAYFLDQFSHIRAIEYAFFGIRAGVLVLILKALIMMFKKSPKGVLPYCIMAFAFLVSAFTDISVLYILIACALIGLISHIVLSGRAKS